MTMGMWNDENGEKCLTKNTSTERDADPPFLSAFLDAIH